VGEVYSPSNFHAIPLGSVQHYITNRAATATKALSAENTQRNIEGRLKEILESEKRKDTVLGVGHKQKMTNKQIFEVLQSEGYDMRSPRPQTIDLS
jgi:polysaccharide deacetylase 2 family uncharacterized protein YibQ